MAATGATLAILTPGDCEIPNGGGAALIKRGNGLGQVGTAALQFQGQASGQGQSNYAIWSGVLPRPATAGYSGTTGIKALITWSGPKTSQAVRWAGGFQLDGATDLPDPTAENFPAYGSANEIAANGNCNTTTQNGLVQTLLTFTIANVKNGQTTAPAAGDHFRFRLRRAVENAGDTLTDYAYVYSVELYDY